MDAELREKMVRLRSLFRQKDIDVNAMCAEGMIPRDQLEDGVTYQGLCRNATEATWHASKELKVFGAEVPVVGCFSYKRQKFLYEYYEQILHVEDFAGFDCFIPIKKLY